MQMIGIRDRLEIIVVTKKSLRYIITLPVTHQTIDFVLRLFYSFILIVMVYFLQTNFIPFKSNCTLQIIILICSDLQIVSRTLSTSKTKLENVAVLFVESKDNL